MCYFDVTSDSWQDYNKEYTQISYCSETHWCPTAGYETVQWGCLLCITCILVLLLRDLSMILCDPFAINTLALSTIRHLQDLVGQDTLPRVSVAACVPNLNNSLN